ncbi:uncharacterized protein LOC127594991 isoform X2 [Hippocampus zosterae]|uniref:uncharacterized protein LOC127594991 isoform X1 n=1 Tax=Hippocampus zosterae TaxID=109293 RepID=UPI00223D1BB2|nr:uncharacterized protein LOC127594991 isoform X1 [Hippocampus zosterae]XP_051912682.1 uncharacterized protein LOC127594991 isoform X1 [Hippocampus zosterae]XP_051912690.1 uncharacterized protein LOC127594991 isoform X2 [Hippocampus zosterae]
MLVTSLTASRLVYDRRSLLSIQQYVGDSAAFWQDSGEKTLPPFLANLPADLFRVHSLPSQKRRRRSRGRGKCSGQLMKLKRDLRHTSIAPAWCALDPVASCLPTVVGSPNAPRRFYPPRLSRGGIQRKLLREFPQARRSKEAIPPVATPTRIGLLNARSLTNKIHILREYFLSNDLDFLCLTETWAGTGEYNASIELLPPDCGFLDTPRTAGRGGGTVSIFKNNFKCKRCTFTTSATSFEATFFEVGRVFPVLCAVIYRPPKYNKDFLSEFSTFLAEIRLRNDHTLLMGILISMCAVRKKRLKNLRLIDSFNFVQYVTSPTHEQGHILDLVFAHGLPVSNLEVLENGISDHMAVLFDVVLLHAAVKSGAPSCKRRIFNPCTGSRFSDAFNNLCVPSSTQRNSPLGSTRHAVPSWIWCLLQKLCSQNLNLSHGLTILPAQLSRGVLSNLERLLA